MSRLPVRLLTLPAVLATTLTVALAGAPAGADDASSGAAADQRSAVAADPVPDGEDDSLPHGRPRSPALEAAARAAVPNTRFEMPFPCGQEWTGTTRASHSPSPLSVDWNRPDDYGARVVAAASGVVTTAYSSVTGGYGKWVVIDHGGGETSLYAHLSAVAVKVGERVDQGQLIGQVGSTGNSTGPHLHFEERLNGSDMSPYFHGVKYTFGTTLASQNCVDVPMAGDMLGSTVTELVVFRRAPTAKFLIRRAHKPAKVIEYGTATDDPVLGDWDGNGRENIGVRNAATRTFSLLAGGKEQTIVFGSTKDKPVAGDWDGDGTWEVGVRRAAKAAFRLRDADGNVTVIPLGKPGDLPITGDWDGDGRTDLGVYDQATSTFTLRLVDSDSLVWTAQVPFGKPGDLPVVGDWDGNGKSDLGVWDPLTAVFSQRQAPSSTAAARQVTDIRFGRHR
ncbi:peptidoglycan DD-metalloendopeptidase family protein [Nocardioides sp.]|uniref:peptidoglycan DD-metalloendopeptidase family protein n=1 Tax=Nocardioides sp. TaxID=35761 RepID=UPI003527E7E1